MVAFVPLFFFFNPTLVFFEHYSEADLSLTEFNLCHDYLNIPHFKVVNPSN